MKRILQFVTILFIILNTPHCWAQTERINTDRPDQTDGTYTVPVNVFQIENGVTIARETILNNFMLRFGVGKYTEVRMGLNAGKEDGFTGLQPVIFSVKQRFVKQNGVLPAIAFIGNIAYRRIATGDFQDGGVAYELKLAFDNDISKRFSIGYNLGTSNRLNDINLTFEGVYALSGNASAFLEYFSTFYHGGSEHNMDAGILYGITPKFQIDFASGFSLSNNGTPRFGTIGVSYLFD